MLHLPVYYKEYQLLLRDFRLYLERLGYHKSSQRNLPSNLQEFFHWLEAKGITALGSIKSGHIIDYHQYLQERPNYTRFGGLSSSIIHQHLYALKTFLKYQEVCGNIGCNPFSVLSFGKATHAARRILSKTEIATLYSCCETLRDRAILGLFYGCGLRKSEVISINISDIHFKSQLLYVRSGKGGKRRVVPFTDPIKEDLRDYYLEERSKYIQSTTTDNQKAFILNNRGDRMRSYWVRLKSLTKRAGLPYEISLHHLRHSIATHLLEGGLSIEQVRDFLGHRYLESTQIYTRVTAQQI